jgi:predicted nucleic acid-binding Zn finger protein
MTSLIEIPTINPSPEVAEDPVARDGAALADAAAKRVVRALELLRADAVESLGNGRYRVRSGGGRGWWAVREGYCNCPDFAWRGVVPCKHIIAVQLARRQEQPAA